MQAYFTMLLLSGAAAGLIIGVLAHPKFYAAVFKRNHADSADHEHSID